MHDCVNAWKRKRRQKKQGVRNTVDCDEPSFQTPKHKTDRSISVVTNDEKKAPSDLVAIVENIFYTGYESVISSLKNEGVYTCREFTRLSENDIRDLSDTNLKNQTRKNMIRLRRMVRSHVKNENN